MYLALKEMKKEKLKFAMIISVTVLIAYLVYFLSSLAFGLAQINRTAIDQWQATGIVLSQDANTNIYASRIDIDQLSEVKVNLDNSLSITSTAVESSHGGEAFDAVIMGFKNIDGPLMPEIKEGKSLSNNDEIILSSRFKTEFNVSIGDTLTLLTNNQTFKVVGFTEESSYNTRPVAYVQNEALLNILGQNTSSDIEIVNAIVTYENVDNEQLNTLKLEYIPIADFIQSLPGYQPQVLTFGLMIISLAIIASIIIGIFMYILTMQKRPIFGVLKIQGYQNKYIMNSVLIQTVILIGSGFLIGLGLTLLTLYFLPAQVPVAINWPLFAAVTAFSLLFSFLGSLFSARSILKIDPLEAL